MLKPAIGIFFLIHDVRKNVPRYTRASRTAVSNICIFARVCKNGRWNSSSARFFNCTETVSLLLLCNVLSDIECNRNYDNDTLCDVLVVCINTKVL